MELPAILSQDLSYLGKMGSARELFESLLANPLHFVLFFESAAEDETWSEKHSAFMKLSLQWFTNQFYEDRLRLDYAKRVVHAVHEHYSVLNQWLPGNILLKLGPSSFKVNSLMWGVASEWLRKLFMYECRDQQKFDLALKVSSLEVFEIIDEFVNKGESRRLWSKNEQEIMAVLQQASEWEIVRLIEECQKILIKYIDDANVLKYLLSAYDNHWLLLRNSCNCFINNKELGVRLEDAALDVFSFEFLDFRESAVEFFDKVRLYITHLFCRFQLPNEELFSEVIHRCPGIKSLSVSESELFSDRLLDLPAKLEELDLSKCSWINHKTLRQIFEHCPSLSSLCLSSNTQLNYTDWSTLRLLKWLTVVDISSCYQVSDQDLKVILQACRSLKQLNLNRCTGLSDLAFFDLARFAPHLDTLNISKCHIFDAGLIDLSARCHLLSNLNVKGCVNLSDRGVIETVKNARNLQCIVLEGCNMSDKTVMAIRSLRPNLRVIK